MVLWFSSFHLFFPVTAFLWCFQFSNLSLYLPHHICGDFRKRQHICGILSHLHCRSPSPNASIVCKTTVCSLCFKCRIRQNISWHCPSSSVTGLFSPSSSSASTPRICTILIKISIDIADCPLSIRLTVFTLIPTFSATFSCENLIYYFQSRIRFSYFNQFLRLCTITQYAPTAFSLYSMIYQVS